ncbi:hypothetical protein [Spirochaeta cellobiosiphila]|uniref:hypothetical protein n=1 Tax=Spirochaeta cellobiosiphila TaxID=504483 RepID=UPI0003FE53D2|nr:hypothetical protein [Spirochaeta cellobiosiphila]
MLVSTVFASFGILSWLPIFIKWGKPAPHKYIHSGYFIVGALAGLIATLLPWPLMEVSIIHYGVGKILIWPTAIYVIYKLFAPYSSKELILSETGIFYLAYFSIVNTLEWGYSSPDLLFWSFFVDLPLPLFLFLTTSGLSQMLMYSKHKESLFLLLPVMIGIEAVYAMILQPLAQLNMGERVLINFILAGVVFTAYSLLRYYLHPKHNSYVRQEMSQKSSWEENLQFGQQCLQHNHYNLAYGHLKAAAKKAPKNKNIDLFLGIGALLNQRTTVGYTHINKFMIQSGTQGLKIAKQYIASLPLSDFERIYLTRVITKQNAFSNAQYYKRAR